MSRLARMGIVLLTVAALGLVACERSKADVVPPTATAEPVVGVVGGEDGEEPIRMPTETMEPAVEEPTATAAGTEEAEVVSSPVSTPEEEDVTTVATPTPTVTADTETPEPSGEERTHVVQRGEWVYSIARQYDGVSPQDIIQANNLQPPNYVVYPGQTLIIPAPSDTTDTAAGETTTYVVRRGDTLTSVAQRFGTTVDAIRRTNNIRGSRIYVGQQLIIPQ